ncbi:MAG: HAD family hydrolase [Fimbriimonadaceae bacterium]|nr:HAD family hydrolase [Fimbriimonadaceae bacterium]
MTVPVSLSRYDGVLFDVDGTLVDSLGMIVAGLGDMFERYAGLRPADEELRSIIGLPLAAQLRLYVEEEPTSEFQREALAFAIGRFEAHKAKESLFEPAVAALSELSRLGYGTCLVTSKTTVELDQFMERFPAADAITATVCASDVPNPKPAADSALLACEKLGLSTDRVLMIGDSIFDLQCAQAAGITAIGVAYGATPYDKLAAMSPDYVFRRPEDLLVWIEQSATPRHVTQERFISTA